MCLKVRFRVLSKQVLIYGEFLYGLTILSKEESLFNLDLFISYFVW